MADKAATAARVVTAESTDHLCTSCLVVICVSTVKRMLDKNSSALFYNRLQSAAGQGVFPSESDGLSEKAGSKRKKLIEHLQELKPTAGFGRS